MKSFIFPSSMETARALVVHLIQMMQDRPDKIFNIAFSGGTTPALMYDIWANEYRDVTPWDRMRLFFVDERCVPPENSESNYGMVRTLLLNVVPLSYNNVFPIYGDNKPDREALRYSELAENELPLRDGLPVFDVVLLGAGSDGHTSSIFPGQEALLSSSVPFEASYNPSNGQQRIAMTGSVILAADKVIFLIIGRSKAEVVNEILYSGDTGPAAYIAHHAEDVELFVDRQATEKCEGIAYFNIPQ